MQYNPAQSPVVAVILSGLLLVMLAAYLAWRWGAFLLRWWAAREDAQDRKRLKEIAVEFHQTNQNAGDVLNFLEHSPEAKDRLLAAQVASAFDFAKLMAEPLGAAMSAEQTRKFWEQLLQLVQEKVNDLPKENP